MTASAHKLSATHKPRATLVMPAAPAPPPEDAAARRRRGAAALARLSAVLRPLPAALVAYSGGVDSAVVLAVAARELGPRAFGVIGHSASLAAAELEAAVAVARELGIRVETRVTDELSKAGYRRNAADRCFFCKDTLYDVLQEVAAAHNAVILDGTHLDDLGEDRPGRRAAREHGVRSPLIEAACGKADIRAMAEALQLPVWNKPAMACLASRIVHGVEVTARRLDQVGQAEAILRERGFTQFRVRSHGTWARLELFPEDMARLLASPVRDEVVAGLRALGFQEVTLDLAGLRDGLRA